QAYSYSPPPPPSRSQPQSHSQTATARRVSRLRFSNSHTPPSRPARPGTSRPAPAPPTSAAGS
ncbi:hypothetical protein LTS18_001574, partial [Coniosporium uncinatum]